MTYKILCTDGFASSGVETLRKNPNFEVMFEKSLSHEDLLAKIPAFDALIVRSASKVSADVIEAGKNLKIIARAGVGTDNIDVSAAQKRGIEVVNAPAGNAISTAELAFALMLSLSRHIVCAASLMRQGVWEKKKFMGSQLAYKTLGVIGMGRIGREIAKRARAFDMRVLGSDPYIDEKVFKEFGVTKCELNELCGEADYITIHTPLSKDTENLITMKELSNMKKTVRIINCARGGIVNEGDLAKALKEGVIAGAALDVFTKEPYDESIFNGMDNVVLTPHLGASTHEAQDAVAVEAAIAVQNFLEFLKISF